MRPVPSPALLRAFLLLPLAACGWVSATTFPNFASSDDPVHIYTSNDWRYSHLQIHPDGRVDGTQPETVYSALIIKPVSAHNVVIIGAKTRLNLCMHSDGNLFGSVRLYFGASYTPKNMVIINSDEDCVFKHTLLETRQDIYESRKHKFLISLGTVKGRLRPNRNTPPFSRFLSRENKIPLSEIYPLRYQSEDTSDGYFKPCVDMSSGSTREESPGEAGIDPCLPIG